MAEAFQWEEKSIISRTWRNWKFWLKGNFGEGLKDEMDGTQLEDHTKDDELLKALRHAPAEIKGFIFWFPFHNHEVEAGFGQEIKFPYLIYFFWSWVTQRQSVFDRSFQPNFVIRERLNSCIRRKPKPPSSFGKQIELHDFRERFMVLSLGKPHQFFLKILSKSEVQEVGNKKVLMA